MHPDAAMSSPSPTPTQDDGGDGRGGLKAGTTRFGPLRGENEQSHELHALREYENANPERTLTRAPEVGHGRVITSRKSQGVLCPIETGGKDEFGSQCGSQQVKPQNVGQSSDAWRTPAVASYSQSDQRQSNVCP
jgi:hypothetical protein